MSRPITLDDWNRIQDLEKRLAGVLIAILDFRGKHRDNPTVQLILDEIEEIALKRDSVGAP